MRGHLIASVVVAAALAGCMSEGVAYYDSESAYPGRVYYYEPWDFDSVYFFDEGRPEFVDHRRFFRDRDRAYYVEKDRRVYYDHDAARARRPPEHRR